VVNLLIRPFRPSCCKGCCALVPFRGGDTSPNKDASFRGDCWARKRNSSIRSLVLLEYAIFMFYNTANGQLFFLVHKTGAEEKASRWGPQRRNCLPPRSPSSTRRWKVPDLSKKEWMRASWKSRRAKQMSCPSKRAEDLRVRFNNSGTFSRSRVCRV
jgi:hypothetical protein